MFLYPVYVIHSRTVCVFTEEMHFTGCLCLKEGIISANPKNRNWMYVFYITCLGLQNI